MATGLGFLDYSEAAELIGISHTTLKGYVCKKKVPFYKIGRRVFFKPDELKEWVNSKKMN